MNLDDPEHDLQRYSSIYHPISATLVPYFSSHSLAPLIPLSNSTVSNLTQSFFEKQAIDKFRPFIQSIVDILLGRLIAKGCSTPIDIVHEFAAKVPTAVINHILGISEKEMDKLRFDVGSSTSRNAAENEDG